MKQIITFLLLIVPLLSYAQDDRIPYTRPITGVVNSPQNAAFINEDIRKGNALTDTTVDLRNDLQDLMESGVEGTATNIGPDSIPIETIDGAVQAVAFYDGDTIPVYIPEAYRATSAMLWSTQSGTNYTPVLADAEYTLDMINVGNDTIQLPTHGDVAFVQYTPINIRNMGGGTTLVRPPDGGSMSGDSIVSENSWATMVKISNTEWDLFGGTE